VGIEMVGYVFFALLMVIFIGIKVLVFGGKRDDK
jgi:hypothetical protein